jgi:excisionase family DNA binding protein
MTQQEPGVFIRASLCGLVLRALVAYLGAQSRRDGGTRPAPGLARLLGQLDMADNGHACATIDETRWVDVAEAARLAGVSERSVRRLAKSGRLIARRHGHRSWLIDADSATGYGRERRRGTAHDD